MPRHHDAADNQVRFQLSVFAYNSANFLGQLALPKSLRKWSLRTPHEKPIKIAAKVVGHSRYAVFQMAEVVVPKAFLRQILKKISRLRASPKGVKTQ